MAAYTPSQSSDSSAPLGKMAVIHFSNDFPSGDLKQTFRRLHNLIRDGRNATLVHFISEATKTVKDEIRQLPGELRRLFPPFDTLLSWFNETELRESRLCGAVDGVLLVMLQLTAYMSHDGKIHQWSEYKDVCFTGLCIGLLAASAVSLSQSLTDLPAVGADAVRLAFRMGVHVQTISEKLETPRLSVGRDTWAYVVLNIEPCAAQRELDAIHARNQCPETGKLFLSAQSRNSVTVSGPPSRLRALFSKSEIFRASTSVPLPVYGGLCHAPHVYHDSDARKFVRQCHLSTQNYSNPPMIPIYSTSRGVPYSVDDAGQLFESVLDELLTKAISWDDVVRGVAERAASMLSLEVCLCSFGHSTQFNEMQNVLKTSVPQLQVPVVNLMHNATDDPSFQSSMQSKLAIVGMSCRLPGGATDTEKFWDILERGLDVSRQIPADRFDVQTHYDPSGQQPNKTMTQYGCFIDEPGVFDAPFFNMSPKEAQAVDPQMRLALVTAYEALERSGYVANRTFATQSQRVGTFYGQAADDYREVNQGQEVGTYYIPGGCRAFGPGRINYFFKFAGPSYSIDTACSSGLAAIEVACQYLWRGEIDMVVTGGLNILTNPDGFTGLCKGHFLTQGHNACKTWDASADGYCRADAIGSVVIKRLEDAQADNDNILGVILGAGTNHCAEAVSITHPHAGHQAYLSSQVLRQAGVDPFDVSYIEFHGTGTQAGDREEMRGIVEVFAPLAPRRNKDKALHIGAVKSNVGHSESAAGTTALIKVLLMLQKNMIPPHVGIKTEINPTLPQDLEHRNIHIPFVTTAWPIQAGKKRTAVVNNFGAAGGNTTLILEEAPARKAAKVDSREIHIVVVSGKNTTSLIGNINRLISYLEDHPDTQLADLAYTTTARRYQHTYRIAIAATKVSQVKDQLVEYTQGTHDIQPIERNHTPHLAFAFTGQGASNKSMNLELYQTASTFRSDLDELDCIAQGQGFPSFIPAVDGSHDKHCPHSPVVTQLALICIEISLAKYWMSLGVMPDVVVGHSLGEYAAMHIAGILTASDTVFLVGRRAQMLQEKCTVGSHSMMAVRASTDQIAKSSAGKPYSIACINSHTDTVLSGTRAQMDDVAKALESTGYRCLKLDVDFAFHSEQMDPILDDFQEIAKGVHFSEPKLPIISPLLGKVVFDGRTMNSTYVKRATRDAVDFVAALNNAERVSAISDETVFLEIGPHPVCTRFIESTLSSVRLAIPSLRRDEVNFKTISEALIALHLAGVPIDWHEYHRTFECELRLLDLPTYAWNNKNYWLQYQGDWCLTKGNTFYRTENGTGFVPSLFSLCDFQTSSVQQIIDQSLRDGSGTVVFQSDLMQSDLFAAAHGHRMNNCGVVTSVSRACDHENPYADNAQSIHADIAFTIASYFNRKLRPTADVQMNIADLVVSKGLVACSRKDTSQLIRITASTLDIESGVIDLKWQNMDSDGHVAETFATAKVLDGRASDWLATWSPITHLVQGRIEALQQLAVQGIANRLSRNMAYSLFANKLVDYDDKYRGMQSIVMHGLEGFADIQLSTKESGVWTVPPFFIDSVAHLAGFIMNCSDALDTNAKYSVTPGWSSMRIARPLQAGSKYRSYVKMIPATEDPTLYLGDVYVMQEGVIIAMVGGIQFRQYPRVLLDRFFSAPNVEPPTTWSTKPSALFSPVTQRPKTNTITAQPSPLSTNPPTAPPVSSRHVQDSGMGLSILPEKSLDIRDTVTVKTLSLVASEAGLELEDLKDDARFTDLGVDSLMSLVLAERIKRELDIQVSSSLFIDFPTVGDFKRWLDESYS